MGVNCGLCCTKINNISVTLGQKEILKDVNIHIHCGHLEVIIGKNGAGKSTLLRAILGEVKHTGEIIFTNKEKNGAPIRIGYVPQRINVENSPMTVYDMIASFTSNKPVFLYKNKKTYEDIKKHLKDFGAEELIDSKVNRLSGGELQRVLLAMATIPYPDLLILDEPISGIDKNGKEQFYKNINDLKNNHDLAIILVSHDFEFVKKYADDVIMLDGKVVENGKPEEVFASKAFKETFGGEA
ncbi:MAG: metal ABC transporter ATP-binding protein [Clostridia bacterium]|nr:metal ABC transporter ATP-binding protein [Clostridia bacterium]